MTNATPLSKKLVAGALMLAVAGASLGYATEAEARRGGKGMNVSFEEIDKNGDGFVTQAEVDAHRLARFAAMDTNGDGALSVEELVAAAKEGAAERIQKRAEKMIEKRDANNDGKITADEAGPRHAGKMIERMDTNNDGQVSKEEFEAAKAKRAEKRGKKRKASE